MTERVTPLTAEEIEELRRLSDAAGAAEAEANHLGTNCANRRAEAAEFHRDKAAGPALARLLSIAADHAQLVAERDALRAELARIRAHIESSHNEVTCSQDARHANDGDDRVPMLTCMTWEAHTLRAEVASLRESEQRIIDGVTETCEAHRLHQTQMRERAEADLTAARKRIEKLESAGATVLRGFEEGAFVRDTRGDGDPAWAIKLLPYLRALSALAATEEESVK